MSFSEYRILYELNNGCPKCHRKGATLIIDIQTHLPTVFCFKCKEKFGAVSGKAFNTFMFLKEYHRDWPMANSVMDEITEAMYKREKKDAART